MSDVRDVDTRFGVRVIEQGAGNAKPLFIWAHGWGQDGQIFNNIASSLASGGTQLILDFPGFGQAPMPPANWGTADYADAAVDIIESLRNGRKVVWIGHSFGGRIGMQLAARHPNMVDGLVLIAAAGLQRRRTTIEQLKLWARIYTYKALKHTAPRFGISIETLRSRFGSTDYKNAGAMRGILLNVVREDLTAVAEQIECPTLLVYGEKDTETPPEIGHRLSMIIKHSDLRIMPGQDHYSLLANGRHLVSKRIAEFAAKL